MSNEDGESQQTNESPGEDRATRVDRGTPRGRQRCGGCGARGVNIRTCPGDGSPHPATTEYAERVNNPPRETNPATADARTAEVRRIVERTRAATDEPHAPVFPLDEPDALLPAPELDESEPVLYMATISVATRYPALVAGRLEVMIEEQLEECLWLETLIVGLRRAD